MIQERKYVTYEQFGAKGDGRTDDLPAIAAAHDYANLHGLDVRAKDDATYYIGGKAITARIMTNTDFGKARFIIDDVHLENIQQPVFEVVSDAERFIPELKSLRHDQEKVDFPHEGTVFVRVYSDARKVYIRKGVNMNAGSDISDAFVVDRDGNVLNSIHWDYETITNAVAFSVDDEPIVIEGGIFTTIANQGESKYNYHKRNIKITRSNVTVQNVTHYVEGELDHGAPYSGFLWVCECYNIVIRDCLLTPHRIYLTEGKLPGSVSRMGSYDLLFSGVIGLKLINIKQTIDILNPGYWGLMGSNFCKELHLDGCVISRFDAHCGVTNGSIKNCSLGHMGVKLIGFGDFTIENSKIFSRWFVNFRNDYGATFQGNLTVRNCEWFPDYRGEDKMYFFWADNTGDHDFGYPCSLPKNIVLDGVTIKDEDVKAENLTYYLFTDYDDTYVPGKPYPYGTPKSVIGRVSSNAARPIKLCEKPQEYPYINDWSVES